GRGPPATSSSTRASSRSPSRTEAERVSGAAAESAGRRFTRTALSMACVLVGLCAVALVAGRDAAPRDGVSANLTGAPRAGPGPVAAGGGGGGAGAPRFRWRRFRVRPARARPDEGGATMSAVVRRSGWRGGAVAALVIALLLAALTPLGGRLGGGGHVPALSPAAAGEAGG